MSDPLHDLPEASTFELVIIGACTLIGLREGLRALAIATCGTVLRPRVAHHRAREVAMTDTLGDALPREMARVRDQVMPSYIEIGPAGAFALHFMRADLDRATQAVMHGDIAEMARAYEALKGYHV